MSNDTPAVSTTLDPSGGMAFESRRFMRFTTSEFALFVQDDWKFRPDLTLNLGLRWSYLSPVTASNGVLGNLALGPNNGLAGATIITDEKLYDADYNNWGPQFGFAWNPSWFENKLVIRGGAGIGYDRLPNALLANARRNPPNGANFGLVVCPWKKR